MKQRIWGLLALCLAAFMSIVGGMSCYPPMPEDLSQTVTLDWMYAELIPPKQANPPTESVMYDPVTFTNEASLTASLQEHDVAVGRQIDWVHEQVVFVSGTAALMEQKLHYGAYALQSRGDAPELLDILADYVEPETTGGFYAEIPMHETHINSRSKLQYIGTCVMTRKVGCSALVRDGLRVVPIYTTFYIRYPIDWNSFFKL